MTNARTAEVATAAKSGGIDDAVVGPLLLRVHHRYRIGKKVKK